MSKFEPKNAGDILSVHGTNHSVAAPCGGITNTQAPGRGILRLGSAVSEGSDRLLEMLEKRRGDKSLGRLFWGSESYERHRRWALFRSNHLWVNEFSGFSLDSNKIGDWILLAVSLGDIAGRQGDPRSKYPRPSARLGGHAIERDKMRITAGREPRYRYQGSLDESGERA